MASASIRDHQAGPPAGPTPAKGRRRYELDTRVLSVFFIVAIPFVAFGAFMVVNMARASLQNAMGDSLSQRALETRQLVERYFADQFVHLRQISHDPQIRAALSAPRKAPGADEKKLEQAWGASAPALVTSVVGSPVAGRLREAAQIHAGYRLLQLADAEGRLVASTSPAGRYMNADSDWFRAAQESFEASGYIGDIRRPPNSSTALIELALPIRDSADGHSLGVIRLMLDAFALYNSTLAPVRVGGTGHAVLVRGGDGLILASDENQRVLKEHFEGFEFIQAASRERRGYWIVPEPADRPKDTPPVARRVVGYAAVDKVPNVDWTVIVEQDLDEAVAPVQSVTWYLWVHFLGVFLVTGLLALYFSFKLEAPVIDEHLHLHEEHVPASMQQADATE